MNVVEAPSPNFDSRTAPPGVLVLHYTGMKTGQEALDRLRDPAAKVSSHYLVEEDGRVFRLVAEERRAWHAGASYWRGRRNLNGESIGIEIVNPGFTDTPAGRIWYAYPQPQIDAVIALVRKIVKEHEIKPDRILGHSDIAPGRKVDPGPRFPWQQLADAGLITWPDAAMVAIKKAAFEQQLPDVAWFQQKLNAHGFAVPLHGEFDQRTQDVVSAFQMKYRQARFDGVPDAETAALLEVLTAPSDAKTK